MARGRAMTASEDFKVTRDGTVVSRDGQTRYGSVERVEALFGGGYQYRPLDEKGERLPMLPCRTQRDAAGRVFKHAQPLTVSDVRMVWADLLEGLTLYPRPVLVGTVRERGAYWSVSRLEGERYWIADAHFTATGAPAWSNGTGSRVTVPHVMDERSTALLDAEVTRQGLKFSDYPGDAVYSLPHQF